MRRSLLGRLTRIGPMAKVHRLRAASTQTSTSYGVRANHQKLPASNMVLVASNVVMQAGRPASPRRTNQSHDEHRGPDQTGPRHVVGAQADGWRFHARP